MRSFLLFFLAISTLFSCSPKQGFEVKDFYALSNFSDSNELEKTLLLDYDHAIENGFAIPSTKQTKNGFFEATFLIKNNNKAANKFSYKIFYQNESYKFDEEHEFSNENFYGSWEDVNVTFVETPEIPNDNEFHLVKLNFRIVGNPRNEKKFYGSGEVGPISDIEIEQISNSIKQIPEWYKLIEEKAKTNEITTELQLKLDAIYTANLKRDEGDVNNKWKRNPRVGNYKFLLVVYDNFENAQKLPEYIKNISLVDSTNKFVNPFSFFKNTLVTEKNKVIYSTDKLKVIAKPNFNNGVFVNNSQFTKGSLDTSYYNDYCNNSKNKILNAHFEQFVSSVVAEHKFKNIPIVADVHGGEYLKKDYFSNFNKDHNFILTNIEVPKCPCKNVKITENKSAELINSATKTGEWRKENVGIISRHGLTYGKYRVKAKLPPLLNKDNLWNGLTNAIWLIYQQGSWNKRRICNTEGGYVLKSYPGHGDVVRVPDDVYSEIDIEIVKASRNWPLSSYGGDASKKPKDPVTDSNKVMVTYTNWDLACKDPKNFNRGVFSISHNDVNYDLHRWDYWYQAITGKYGVLSDELFKSDYYWYEIEWKPEEIIWRIGPEKDQMYEIGYMNSTITSVPNNQMLLIVTQEWHLENWWPEAPFNQNYIPFPSKEIKGEILEVEIE